MGNTREIIRSNLERYLAESGYSQKEFAEELGVSKSSVTNWVKGKNSPDVDLVVPICKLLNITIKDFYSDSSQEKSESQVTTGNGKKVSITDKAAPEHKQFTLEESNRLLVAMGFIKEGEDLSADDLAFLENIIGLLNTWFIKRK